MGYFKRLSMTNELEAEALKNDLNYQIMCAVRPCLFEFRKLNFNGHVVLEGNGSLTIYDNKYEQEKEDKDEALLASAKNDVRNH